MKHKIYQIFYDRKTADQILPGLIPYDNSKPINSSWYEYSVIRDILQKNKIGDDDYLGILSPRFFDKTGINGEALLKILDKSSSDVISFSSDIWSNARYLNSVLQAESHHPGIFHLTKKILSKLDIPLNSV